MEGWTCPLCGYDNDGEDEIDLLVSAYCAERVFQCERCEHWFGEKFLAAYWNESSDANRDDMRKSMWKGIADAHEELFTSSMREEG